MWRYIETQAGTVFAGFGFFEIRPPVLEKSKLFQRSIGEHTDIVEKEMYTFADRKGEAITLRPEATASVVRAYIQHKLYADKPVQKFYTIGPMFRRERPQKGRYRQFHQINAEVFGAASPYADAQLIFMLTTFLERLPVTDTTIHINSLGCRECRPSFKEKLFSFFQKHRADLCEDCRRRLERNPLRILDCKGEGCRAAAADAPVMTDFLCRSCHEHFDTVTALLKDRGVLFEVDRRLVRGLDYYTRTTFEVQTGRLGAQNAIAGGGRYDNLVGLLGGPDQPAVGFAVGLERLVELLRQEQKFSGKSGVTLFLAALDEISQRKVFEWMCQLNQRGISAEMSFAAGSLKSQLKQADKLGADFVLMIGENERTAGAVVLRDMATGEQRDIPLAEVVPTVLEILDDTRKR